jgi:hypothetical protein
LLVEYLKVFCEVYLFSPKQQGGEDVKKSNMRRVEDIEKVLHSSPFFSVVKKNRNDGKPHETLDFISPEINENR